MPETANNLTVPQSLRDVQNGLCIITASGSTGEPAVSEAATPWGCQTRQCRRHMTLPASLQLTETRQQRIPSWHRFWYNRVTSLKSGPGPAAYPVVPAAVAVRLLRQWRILGLQLWRCRVRPPRQTAAGGAASGTQRPHISGSAL